jgi:hypothetical protein
MQNVSERARKAAEAELDLLRIRKIRAALFESLYFANEAAPDRLTELNDKLAKLERYERRAFSRRKRALRAILYVPARDLFLVPHGVGILGYRRSPERCNRRLIDRWPLEIRLRAAFLLRPSTSQHYARNRARTATRAALETSTLRNSQRR